MDPPREAFKSGSTINLKITWLRDNFTELPVDADDDVIMQHARG